MLDEKVDAGQLLASGQGLPEGAESPLLATHFSPSYARLHLHLSQRCMLQAGS